MMPTAAMVGPDVTASGLSVLNVQPIAKAVLVSKLSIATEFHGLDEEVHERRGSGTYKMAPIRPS